LLAIPGGDHGRIELIQAVATGKVAEELVVMA